MRPTRERIFLGVVTAIAVGAPICVATIVAARTRTLADHLSTAGGVPAHIGAVDADLTGSVRILDFALGGLVRADEIQASVAMSSLLSGQLGADEIHVMGPRIAIRVDATGDSDLARLVKKLARAGAGHGDSNGRVRRIVVDSGSLSAHVEGVGDITAQKVELVPDAGGVRVVTGPVRLDGTAGPLRVELAFARSAAEVALPHFRFGRVLAVGGTGTVIDKTERADLGSLALHDVAIGRLRGDGSLEMRADVEDGTARREIAAELHPKDFALALRGDRVPLAALAGLAPHGVDVSTARASGQLTLRKSGDALEVVIDGSLEGARLDHAAVAAGAVPIAAAVRGTVTISPEAVAVAHGAIDVGAAHWTASGWLRRGTPASGQLDLALAPAPCGELLGSLPAELRGPLDGLQLTGTLGGTAHLAIDLAAPLGDGAQFTTALTGRCEAAAEPPCADVTALAGVAEQLYPDGTRARVGRGTPGWYELARISPYVRDAFVAAEDAMFWLHHGFDEKQIARSLEIDLREHRLARGGSTISQQLVKNAFLSQRRSLDRKIQEAILTWRLEAKLDKKQILERYLNIIELGPRIYGIGAAAKHWFGVSPRELNVKQAAFLAAMTSEPTSMSRRVRRQGGLDADTAARVDIVLRAMNIDGMIDAAELELGRSLPLTFLPAAMKAEP